MRSIKCRMSGAQAPIPTPKNDAIIVPCTHMIWFDLCGACTALAPFYIRQPLMYVYILSCLCIFAVCRAFEMRLDADSLV